MAEFITVCIQLKGQTQPSTAHEPQDRTATTKPDRILPILNSWGLVGEVQIWRGDEIELPSVESRLMRNIALQIGLAIERVQITEYEFQRASAHENVSE